MIRKGTVKVFLHGVVLIGAPVSSGLREALNAESAVILYEFLNYLTASFFSCF